jgi:ascorbate-specific PTS system EIIC-type component UlaA
MSNNTQTETGNAYVAIALIVAAAITFIIWKFSTAINVDFSTGSTLLFRAAIVLAPSVFLLWNGFAKKMVLPVCLGGIAWSLFSLLDYWSSQALPSFLHAEPQWYARWYSEAAFLLVFMVIGYLIGKKYDDE